MRRNQAFLTTETEGLLETQNLRGDRPLFRPVESYPFRVFFNPFDPREVWATSFGGGLRVTTRGNDRDDDR